METWSNRELPVLETLVTLFEDVSRYKVLLRELVGLCEQRGLAEQDVYLSLRALATAQPPFVTGNSVSGLIYPLIITGVTERARWAVGQWPSPDDVTMKLVQALQEAARDEPDEERQGLLRRTAAFLGGLAAML